MKKKKSYLLVILEWIFLGYFLNFLGHSFAFFDGKVFFFLGDNFSFFSRAQLFNPGQFSRFFLGQFDNFSGGILKIFSGYYFFFLGKKKNTDYLYYTKQIISAIL